MPLHFFVIAEFKFQIKTRKTQDKDSYAKIDKGVRE